MGSNAKVFISYAREDEKKVNAIYSRLTDKGFNPWMDTINLLPGENWKYSIEKQIRNSDIFLVCLSNHFSQKRGFLQREIKIALDTLQEMIESDIYLIPARLENCDVPESLKPYQWVDLFEDKNWEALFKAIEEGVRRRNTNSSNIITNSNIKTDTQVTESNLETESKEMISLTEEEKIGYEKLSPEYRMGFKSTPLQSWISKLINQHDCKILIYGLPGCGKTSFIRRINYLKTPNIYSSTEGIDIYQSSFTFRARNTSSIKISIADYKGSRPSQILVDPPEKFFGSKENRNINFLYFMVDLLPPRFETKSLTDEFVSEKEILEQINQRIKQNLEYISMWAIAPLLAASYSEKNLHGIKLIINKIDIIDNLISLGYLSESIDVKKLYKPLIKTLINACAQNNISDNFSIHVISTKTNAGIQKLLVETIENYFNGVI